MATTYVANAFSLSMLGGEGESSLECERLAGADDARAWLHVEEDGEVVSCVGHTDTAAIFAAELGRPVPVARISVALNHGDTVFVGQYTGPRLPEGAKTLPEGAKIVWWKVRVLDPDLCQG